GRIVGVKFMTTPYCFHCTVTVPRPLGTMYGISPPTRNEACVPGIVIRLGDERTRVLPLLRIASSVGARNCALMNLPTPIASLTAVGIAPFVTGLRDAPLLKTGNEGLPYVTVPCGVTVALCSRIPSCEATDLVTSRTYTRVSTCCVVSSTSRSTTFPSTARLAPD